MKAKYLMIATVAILLAACSNDENEVNNGPVEARITATMGAETRAVNDDDTFEANNEIGVMVTKVEQTPSGSATSGMVDRYKNVRYKATGSGSSVNFEAAEKGKGIFFQDATETVTFAAYYPYQASADAGTLPKSQDQSDGVIKVDTKESNTSATQATIDFLFASGATASKTNSTVEFKESCQFQHRMAQLKLEIIASTEDGFNADEAAGIFSDAANTYKLGGLIHDGTFTLNVAVDGTATGIAAATTGGTTVDGWDITGCVHKDEASSYTRTYTLILLPQNVSSGSALKFEANIGGQTYKNDNKINPNLEAGKTYTYTIMVKKKGLTVSNCNIKAWEPGGNGEGDAEM